MNDEPNHNIMHELWGFLTQGIAPQDCIIEDWNPLPPHQAMSIIWVLQEVYHLLPDVWEHCVGCDRLFDTDDEYYIVLEEGYYCGNCANDVGTECQLCFEGVRWKDATEAEYGDYFYCPKCWELIRGNETD